MSDSHHTLLIGVDGGGAGCRAAKGTLDGAFAFVRARLAERREGLT